MTDTDNKDGTKLPPIFGAQDTVPDTNRGLISARDKTQTDDKGSAINALKSDDSEDGLRDVQLDKPEKDDGLAYLEEQDSKPEAKNLDQPVERDEPTKTDKKPMDKTAIQRNLTMRLAVANQQTSGLAQKAHTGGKPSGSPGKGAMPRVSYMELYKYSSSWDKFLVRAGIFFSLTSGVVLPFYAIIIGEVVKIFDPDLTSEEMHSFMGSLMTKSIIIAIVCFFTSYLGYALMQISSERLSFKLRALYLDNLLRQEVAYFEKQQIEALPSKMAEYFTHISEGSGEKTGQLVSTVGASLSGIVLGLYINPYYGLCLLVYLPFASIAMNRMSKNIIAAVIAKLKTNGVLGGFTEELLSSLKLIISFGKEKMKFDEYAVLAEKAYKQARSSAIKQGFLGGAFFGLIIGFSNFSWAIGFLFIKYDVRNVKEDRVTTVSDIVGAYQALMFGMFTVIQVQNLIPMVIRALTVGKQVIDVIDRVPEIRAPEITANLVKEVKIGDSISFNDVHFKYPTAVETAKPVFSGASFKIKSGTSTAIVGPSGSGKSTIVQMINRFYDPSEGDIKYGETPLKNIDLPSLRKMIGWVGQEPVLIVGSIRENLMYGNKDATEQQLESAINKASANFIYNELEKKLETYVGSSTVLNLSGGQKQRIAIARALIKNPQILVLDEATSALDPKSEAEVQNAIVNVQKQQKNLTIIMIAHRLQTIMTADNLLYLESPTSVIAAQKGTPEYDAVMDKLKKTNYAHQADQLEQDQEQESVDSDDDNNDARSAHSAAQSQYSNKSMQMNKEARRESRVIKEQIRKASQLTPAQRAAMDEVKAKEEKIVVPQAFISRNAGWSRLFSYYKPHITIFFMVLLALINACALPAIAMMIINLQFTYYSKDTNEDWESEAKLYLLLMLCWVLVIFIFNGLEKSLFMGMGEKLTFQLRLSLIEEILHKQISWFDREDRAPGIITNIISADIASLNGMTSEVLVTIFELVCVIVIGLVGGIYFCWQAAILCFLVSPIMVVGMYLMSTMQWGNKGGRRTTSEESGIDNYERANSLLSDVVINYRTIISFGQENVDTIIAKFQDLCVGPMEDVVKKSNRAGLYYGLGSSGRILFITIVFLLGIEFLVYRWEIDSTEVFSGIYLLFFTYMSIGAQAANVPSIKKAKASAIPVFSIIDEPSALDVRKPEGRHMKTVEKGKIEFKNVTFNYPTRAQKVMNNFNIEIPAGAKIALVGHSGCGKSTLTNIMMGFYNIQDSHGYVEIDGKNLNTYDMQCLRENYGYVMQEPVLFNKDIKTNIRFGKPDATDEEVYIAAKKANALGFIEQNEDDLSAEEKAQKLDNELKECFSVLEKKYLALYSLSQEFDQGSKDVKTMIVDLMTSLNDELLAQANGDSAEFLQAAKYCVNKYGTGWEDIVMRFEWRNELKAIRESSKLTQNFKDNLNSALEKTNDLYSFFDLAYLEKIASSGVTTEEDLIEHIRSQLSEYKMTTVNKRYHQLQFMAIDKKRDANGVFKLHEGFDKDCGLKGGKLSGGQKQRVAIARALIKDPKILILDEATSALDEQSQEIVQQALDRAMEGRTSIVIAHRLSTIRNCDILFVLGNGHVLESGSYDELASDYNSHFNVLKAGMEN